jgi:hypothetical protein
MAEEKWEVVDEIQGDMQAEILKGLLEAQGIKVWLSQEGIGHSVFPVTISTMGTVQLLVPHHQAQSARAILDDYYAGNLENMDLETPPEDQNDPEA